MWQALSPRGWRAAPLQSADTFWARWRGLRPAPAGKGLVIAGCSVHTFGMREPLWVVGLDGKGTVVVMRRVSPGRVVMAAGARTILELPQEWPPPELGDTVTLLPLPAGT